MTRVASIDIGTNTIRLLISDIDTENLKRVLTKRNITRLGDGFVKGRTISSGAIKRSINVLDEYLKLVKEYDVKKTFAVATSAVREAANRDEFLKLVYENTGLEVCVVSGKEEAMITLAGVISVTGDLMDRALVIDIGGGSTELVVVDGKTPVAAHSLDLGVVHLTERFIRSDPPSSFALEKLKEFVYNELYYVLKNIIEPQVGPSLSSLVGTAGTVTTLAAITQEMNTYAPERINGCVLTRESVKAIWNRLKKIPVSERCMLPGLERGREDIILAGMVVVLEIMEVFDFGEMMVSDYGLLEGIIIDAFRKT